MRQFDGITFGMESQNAAGLRALKKKVFFAEVTPRGYSHPVTFATDAAVICNEEGRLRGMAHNVKFLGVDFVGPILIVGVADDEFTDLSPEHMGFLLDGLKTAAGEGGT